MGKKVPIFFAIFAMVMIGGFFALSLWILPHSGCQKNGPVFERFFAETTYTSLLYFGTYF